MSFDQQEFGSALDESPFCPTSGSDLNTTAVASDVIEIELVEEWLPRDPARTPEAIVIMLFVVFGCGLAVWAMESLQ